MRHVTLGHQTVSVHIEEPASPNGLDVVLVHGAGFDHTVWRFQTRFLAGRGFRTLAPDLPGHGSSDGPALGSIEEMAIWISELSGALEVRRPVMIGHSMGTYVALQCATSAPGSVLALVLVGTTDRMAVHPELLEAATARDHHAIDLMIGWMHSGRHRYGGHRSAGSWTAGSSRRTLERNLAVLGGDLAACAAFDPTSIAADVECPTLIVSGSEDKMTRASGAERLAGVMGSHPEHHLVDEAGHMALFERAEEVNASLVGFLSRTALVAG